MRSPRRTDSAGPRSGVPALRRLERWLWTGPVGHLVGGALDFAGALAHYRRARRRARRPR
ncbi:MAG TPA: hypothetical protein VMU32_02230 [Solirubrobacteraceae bacterium]|nr:hypothetical protein [Solirubrobacteraceae bacterium]